MTQNRDHNIVRRWNTKLLTVSTTPARPLLPPPPTYSQFELHSQVLEMGSHPVGVHNTTRPTISSAAGKFSPSDTGPADLTGQSQDLQGFVEPIADAECIYPAPRDAISLMDLNPKTGSFFTSPQEDEPSPNRNTEKPYLCTHDECERSQLGYGFRLRWNLIHHTRGVHDDYSDLVPDASLHSSEAITSSLDRKKKLDLQTAAGAASAVKAWYQHNKALERLVHMSFEPDDPRTIQCIKDAQDHCTAMARISHDLARSSKAKAL